MLYTGIDLHKRSVVIATVNERGEIVREESVPAFRALEPVTKNDGPRPPLSGLLHPLDPVLLNGVRSRRR